MLSKRSELFDVVADPAEQRSLVDGRPDLVEQARGLLAEHAARTRAIRTRLSIRDGMGRELSEKRKKLLRSHGYIK